MQREVLQRVHTHGFVRGCGRDEGQVVGVWDGDPGARIGGWLEVCKGEDADGHFEGICVVSVGSWKWRGRIVFVQGFEIKRWGWGGAFSFIRGGVSGVTSFLLLFLV